MPNVRHRLHLAATLHRQALTAVLCGTLASGAIANPGASASGEVEADADRRELRQFTFAWPFTDDSKLKPRGGTTKGPDLTIRSAPTPEWVQLQDDDLSKLERDRRAILAMAGPYRASFDFLETTGFVAEYRPPRPYQSWGTEHVYVVVDEPKYIALQHVLVMQIVQEDGTISEPFVVKHWRQDWRYEDRDLHAFVGDKTWAHEKLSRNDVRGAWTQAVFQVDDSPRYEAIGRWQHSGGVSTWLSSETWRPLPRREFSVRDDYDVLIGTNRHTITPTGWVHEENNLKVVLNEDGTVDRAIAKETGFNRYERVEDYDWSAGDAYWTRTAPFWQAVRSYWAAAYKANDRLRVTQRIDDKSLMFTLFQQAEESAGTDPDAIAALVSETIAPFVTEGG
ncbi:MAG: DUF6607 family protein [Pseudomonadota bacterium]